MNYTSEIINEWYEIVKPIITNSEFQKRKEYKHHGSISVYDHSLNVSIKSYMVAKKMHTDYKNAAIAGLLHDFYETPWMEIKEKKPLFKKHGFTHAKNALNNSNKYFKNYLNPTIENAILRHMFPLNIIPPKTLVGWIVTYSDKKISLECLKEPSFFKRLLYNKNSD